MKVKSQISTSPRCVSGGTAAQPWSQVPNSGVDTEQNRIYANITSFSIFAPMVEGDTMPPSVTNLNVTPSAPKMDESVNITVDASDTNMNFTSVYVSVINPDGT